MAKEDYYETLNCSRNASTDELKKAYRKKAKELHPDRNSDNPKAEEQFKAVNEAYDILRDPEKRSAYDRFGHAAFEGGTSNSGFRASGQTGDFGSAFSDVFEDLFGDFMGSSSRRNSQRASRGSDLRYNLNISLADAYKGKKTIINVPSAVTCDACSGIGSEGGVEATNCPTCAGIGKVRAQQGFFTVERTCPTCAGKGKIIKNPCKNCLGQGRVEKERKLNVTIPAGVETGTRIRLANEGEAGLRGGPNGDLYIFIEVSNHQIFEREAQDLFCRIPISMTTAALGGDLEAPTLDGGKSRVKVPSGVQSGKRLRLKGKGMPSLRGNSFGDLYVELEVETPVNLTSKQKKLLMEFQEIGVNNNPAESNFFSRVRSFWEDLK